MARASFELEQPIAVAPSVLHAFLCDLDAFHALHPLIVAIEPLPPSAELPGARRYRVTDHIPLGPFTLRTAYTAALDPVADDEVHGYAWQKPGIRLHTVYRLHGTPEGEYAARRALRDRRAAPPRGFHAAPGPGRARRDAARDEAEARGRLSAATARLRGRTRGSRCAAEQRPASHRAGAGLSCG